MKSKLVIVGVQHILKQVAVLRDTLLSVSGKLDF